MMAPLIVLLGNDASSLAALHEVSSDAGYRTLRCRPQEVTDARAVLKRADADLAILDLWAARREDGWAFLRRLWADIDTTHLPSIVVTGETEAPPMGADLLRTMHCQVMRKPLDARELLRKIAAALGPSPATRARGNPPRRTLFRVGVTDYSLATADGGDA